MAVMTSQHPEGVAFEQKTHPVPSSDKMALDLDINGTAVRNETNLDTVSPDAAPLKEETVVHSPSIPQPSLEVNGANNASAFSSNQTIETIEINASEFLFDSQPTNSSPASAPTSSQLPESNITTTELQPSTPPEAPHTSIPSSIESAIKTEADSNIAMSAVPPIIEAQQSDRRTTSSPLLEPTRDSPSGLPLSPIEDTKAAPRIEHATGNAESEFTSAPSPTTTSQPSIVPQRSQPMLGFEKKNHANTPPEHQAEQGATVAHTTEPDDIEMTDTPQSLVGTKVAREREDDDDMNEPSAKRSKTEDTAMTDSPAPNGASFVANGENEEITEYQAKELVKAIKSVLRTKAGLNFRGAVATLWPQLATDYLRLISHPMDLLTIEEKLLSQTFYGVNDLKNDLELLVSNSATFNTDAHVVTASARTVRDKLLQIFATIPREPPPKKNKKGNRPTPPVRNPTPQTSPPPRPARAPRPVPAPPVASPAPIYALDPNTNTPLIRRDSTKTDGRPKREIHPPKNKDLPYSNSRPKKNSKSALELRFCETVLDEMMKQKYNSFSDAFKQPVDPIALAIPTYHTIIKNPMDMSTIANQLKSGVYRNAADFEKDIKLMFKNCFTFNPEPHPVAAQGRQYENLFKAEWAKKEQFMANHAPRLPSPDSADEEEGEEEYEDAAAEGSSTTSTLLIAKDRLLEEQTKLLQMLGDKNTPATSIEIQQSMVKIVSDKVAQEEANEAKKKKSVKSRAPKPNKKAAPAKKPQIGAKQKSGHHQKPKKQDRNRTMTTVEKETISAGINQLPEDKQDEVLNMIKAEQEVQDEDGTVELDIESINQPLLWRIFDLITLHLPHVKAQIESDMAEKPAPQPIVAKPPPKKKNKPMSKTEQERKIQVLQEKVQEYNRHASGSQEPVIPTVEQQEQQEESSGDEDSDSEEE